MLIGAILNLGAGFMNGGAGSGTVDFFHGFQFALMLTIMLSLTQFVWWRAKMSRRGSTWEVHQPTLIMLLASCLVVTQPLAILVIGSFKLCCNTCDALTKGADLKCTTTGYSYPPWTSADGLPEYRQCSAPGGNVFWDVSYCTGGKYPIFPTVWSGWLIQIFCTWGGFLFMFISIMQVTRLHTKIRNRWRAIQSTSHS